jgi:hypothetical protein
MNSHQNEGMNRYLVFIGVLMKLIKINGVVVVVKKCGLSVITTLHDMLSHFCNVQSGKPGHCISLNNFIRAEYQPEY